MRDEFSSLEQQHGGRLGVAVLDIGSGMHVDHRGDEQFPLCSTFKFLAAAFVLARADYREDSLDRRIVFSRTGLVSYSPITEKHADDGAGMTLAELAEAAVTLSDNTAGNLLLDSFGGPAALTAYLRSLGDPVTRLDQREPALNEAAPGDPRDTTIPLAMLEDLRRFLVGTALSAASRERLIGWLIGCKTGDKRLRAGIPMGWRVGDKTGSGERNTTNDIAVIWPPGRGPLLVTAYFTGSPASLAQRGAVLAQIGRTVTDGR